MTSQSDEARAVGAMKGGAIDHLVKSRRLTPTSGTLLERALSPTRCQTEAAIVDDAESFALRESEERFQLQDGIQRGLLSSSAFGEWAGRWAGARRRGV